MSVREFCPSCGAHVIGTWHLDSQVDGCEWCSRTNVRSRATGFMEELHADCKVCETAEGQS